MRILLLLILLVPASVLAFSYDNPLKNPSMEEEAKDIFSHIRCVVCEGQSVADSNVELAKDLRRLIRDKVKKGQNREEIIGYISSIYGDEIMFKPPFRFNTYILWLLPFAVLASGFFIIFHYFRVQKHPKK